MQTTPQPAEHGNAQGSTPPATDRRKRDAPQGNPPRRDRFQEEHLR